MSQEMRQAKVKRTTNNNLNPLSTCVDPPIPLIPPIEHTVTYRVNSVEHFHQVISEDGYVYIRLSNPTCEAAAKAINDFEGGFGSIMFSSGMAAISTALLTFLQPGDHIVVQSQLYGCAFDLIKHYMKERLGVEVTFVDISDVETFRAAIRHNTKLLYGETPSNPTLAILDLERFGQLGSEHLEILTVVDATFASPYLQKPMKYGIDIVVHSATKFIGGHEDVCAGVLTTRTEEQWNKIVDTRLILGGILSPHDASLLLRGLKTLRVRMERQSDTAGEVARFLSTHPAVEHVNYPGMPSHPQHQIAKKQMTKFGSMMSFIVVGGDNAAITVVNSLRTFKLAVSLGGVDSLVEHPASMTHGPLVMTEEDRKINYIDPALIRLGIGMEDAQDLICDLQQALDLIVAPDTSSET